jgi:hypothetical protein
MLHHTTKKSMRKANQVLLFNGEGTLVEVLVRDCCTFHFAGNTKVPRPVFVAAFHFIPALSLTFDLNPSDFSLIVCIQVPKP